MQRILGTLIRNAAKAMKEHDRADKSLVIRGARVEGRCEIELIDHGPGVRQNIRSRLFEPFVSAAPEAGGAIGWASLKARMLSIEAAASAT